MLARAVSVMVRASCGIHALDGAFSALAAPPRRAPGRHGTAGIVGLLKPVGGLSRQPRRIPAAGLSPGDRCLLAPKVSRTGLQTG